MRPAMLAAFEQARAKPLAASAARIREQIAAELGPRARDRSPSGPIASPLRRPKTRPATMARTAPGFPAEPSRAPLAMAKS